jgi:hypothetical protein
MNVGHVMYDIALMQVLQSTTIDRIILQRAPCMNMNLCSGLGTFETFFKGMYIAMIEAANASAHIPIFVRWTWQVAFNNSIIQTYRLYILIFVGEKYEALVSVKQNR